MARGDAWTACQRPKGVLITGVPGCGKSLTAKCVPSLWELPLLRSTSAASSPGSVGSSEQNMRAALRTAEAIAPSMLWIDEIEKGFAQPPAASETAARPAGSSARS